MTWTVEPRPAEPAVSVAGRPVALKLTHTECGSDSWWASELSVGGLLRWIDTHTCRFADGCPECGARNGHTWVVKTGAGADSSELLCSRARGPVINHG